MYMCISMNVYIYMYIYIYIYTILLRSWKIPRSQMTEDKRGNNNLTIRTGCYLKCLRTRTHDTSVSSDISVSIFTYQIQNLLAVFTKLTVDIVFFTPIPLTPSTLLEKIP
jgi:hypothetical protein